MNLEEVDESYQKEKETSEKQFLDGLKNKGNRKQLEQEFVERSKKVRDKYQQSAIKVIKNPKKLQKKKEKKQERVKPFKVKKANLELSQYEKAKIAADTKWFRWRISIKRKFERVYYPHLAYYYYKAKYELRSVYKTVNGFIERTKRSIAEKIKSTLALLKKIAIASYKKPLQLLKFLLSKVLKKKKGKEEDDKKESDDEESAEKTEEKKEESTEAEKES